MDTDWAARGIALSSALIAVLSLGWAIASWRLSGPRLRLHAMLYQDALAISVFNAGRTADTVERLVLGGTRGGVGGQDLTHWLDGPLRLEPGQSKRMTLTVDDALQPARRRRARAGWECMWLLTGSMQEPRAEVVCFPGSSQQQTGWRLVPRRAKYSRYAPLLLWLYAIAVSHVPPAGRGPLIAPLVLMLLVVAYAKLVAGRPSRRGRVEGWTLALGVVLAASIPSPGVQAAAAMDAAQWMTLLYFAWALTLAVPGLMSRTLDELDLASAWLRRRLAGPSPN